MYVFWLASSSDSSFLPLFFRQSAGTRLAERILFDVLQCSVICFIGTNPVPQLSVPYVQCVSHQQLTIRLVSVYTSAWDCTEGFTMITMKYMNTLFIVPLPLLKQLGLYLIWKKLWYLLLWQQQCLMPIGHCTDSRLEEIIPKGFTYYSFQKENYSQDSHLLFLRQINVTTAW